MLILQSPIPLDKSILLSSCECFCASLAVFSFCHICPPSQAVFKYTFCPCVFLTPLACPNYVQSMDEANTCHQEIALQQRLVIELLDRSAGGSTHPSHCFHNQYNRHFSSQLLLSIFGGVSLSLTGEAHPHSARRSFSSSVLQHLWFPASIIISPEVFIKYLLPH